MDYSLLVGIKRKINKSIHLSPDDPAIYVQPDPTSDFYDAYYFGLIDILQEWNYSKKSERFLKGIWYWSNTDGISAIGNKMFDQLINILLIFMFNAMVDH